MKKSIYQSLLSLLLCLLLTTAVAVMAVSCGNHSEAENPKGESSSTDTAESLSTSDSESESDTTDPDAPIVKGEGQTVFLFTVVDGDGNESRFEIHTDETMVGAALQSLGLIEGKEGPYGLYVKKVNGILADYEQNGTYWAFYVNGDYGMTGVDLTEIQAGTTYMFKVSK